MGIPYSLVNCVWGYRIPVVHFVWGYRIPVVRFVSSYVSPTWILYPLLTRRLRYDDQVETWTSANDLESWEKGELLLYCNVFSTELVSYRRQLWTYCHRNTLFTSDYGMGMHYSLVIGVGIHYIFTSDNGMGVHYSLIGQRIQHFLGGYTIR